MKNGSQIFELFGYPVDSWNSRAAKNLVQCRCPFMAAECDGGGNRYSSGINLLQNKKLQKHFPGKKIVQAGVCSLQLKSGQQPWIVCPRRLLNYRQCGLVAEPSIVRDKLQMLAGLESGKTYSVWSEVKMKCDLSESGKNAFFDYTFDYVIAGSRRLLLEDVENILGKTGKDALKQLDDNGYTVAFRDGKWYCDNFPSYPFVIVEVMTSSTSGGNKAKRSQIGQLFEDTVYRLAGERIEAGGPGINYRQVWARMVSQMLVKSQIAMKWGGKTFWVLQDLLAEYITKTTALNLSDFLSEHCDEVNVLSGGYGKNIDPRCRRGDFAEIDDIRLFAGPVSAGETAGKSFSDIVKLGAVPDVTELWRHLSGKMPCAKIVI